MQVAAKGLSYAALAIVVAAPFLAAFRGSATAAPRRRALATAPSHALVQTADRSQAHAQLQACFLQLCFWGN